MYPVTVNYNNWQFWGEYNPPLSLGEQKVVFDGPNRLIIVNTGVTSLDFREDVYSAWKEWLTDPNQQNAEYAPAISAIGGDPLPGDRRLGTTYFLENGWRMRTWEGNHELTVSGNFFTREGVSAFVPTVNPWTITINLNTSTLVETLETQSSSLTTGDIDAITTSIWNDAISGGQSALDLISAIPDNVWDEIIDNASTTAREKLRKIATKTQDIALR